MGLPTGPAVTFLFTDIEGSTRLERSVGSVAWAPVVARHDSLLRAAIEGHDGVVVKTEGDAFFAAFAKPIDAALAAVAAQRALADEPWPPDVAIRVRMGLHTGQGRLRTGRPEDPDDYVGIDVNYAARIAAVGNGGQIVLSDIVEPLVRVELGETRDAEGVELVDDGLRAVKDFEEPRRLHRLVVPGVADDDRRLRTMDAPSNLPADVTELVGREAEIAVVTGELLAGRIVTLTGPGGSGKTRLALGTARAVAGRFPHGTWFVDLAALRDPGLIGATIAATIGVRESGEQPVDDALRGALRDQMVLIVLDNLEQLLPSGADSVAALVRAAPGLHLLLTSRELLRIAGERGHPVPPLDAAAGVALFEDRLRSVRPDFLLSDEARAAVRAICDRLGGLPLAIELAAARTRTLSPGQVLERLGRNLDLGGGPRDLPERQRTLRGAIAWSHDLLTVEERRLFRRLAVFAGGWALAQAEAVTDLEGDLGIEVLGGLEALADKSLLRIEPVEPTTPDGEARFGIHPLLREFALERLEESGERSLIEGRHAAVMTDLAETLGADILSAAGETSMRHLDHEAYNLRAAVDWALANERPDLGLRLVASTWRWYQQRGRLREGRWLLAELLSRPDLEVGLRIRGLAADGGLAYWMDDIAGARAAYEERLALAEATGDVALIADGHYDLGFVFMVLEDGEALTHHERLALEGYRAAGRESDATRAQQAFVLSLFLAGHYAEARDQQEAAIEEFQRRDSQSEVADSSTLLSAIMFRLEDAATAWDRATSALRFFAAGDLSSGIARAMVMAAMLQVDHGDPAFGARIAGATHELARERNLMLSPITVLHLPDPAATAAERLGPARAEELLRQGAGTPLAAMIEEVLGTAWQAAAPPVSTTV